MFPRRGVTTNGIVLVSDRIDPTTASGFTPFRGLGGTKGNSAVGFTADIYGISEAWLRMPLAPEVHRAQATPAQRPPGSGMTFDASAWSIDVQSPTGAWSSPALFVGSANRGNEVDSGDDAGVTTPQLMAVGNANPQIFACAGGRTEDNRDRTTWLIESLGLTRTTSSGTRVAFIQDVLNGDGRFVPNKPGPLIGPPNPPSPAISGPGNPIKSPPVQCAMLQQDDDVATRELHVIGITNGSLYHSMATDFGPTIVGNGGTFNRFRAVSSWGDAGQALGGGFGTIVSAALVASRPQAISVFFIAESGGRYKLWHAVRFSGGGSWRPAEDVFAINGDAPAGTVYRWDVAAASCPAPGATSWTAQNSELLIALWGGPNLTEVAVIRVVNGSYSHLSHVQTLQIAVPSRMPTLHRLTVTARPFRDDGKPVP